MYTVSVPVRSLGELTVMSRQILSEPIGLRARSLGGFVGASVRLRRRPMIDVASVCDVWRIS